MSILKTIKGTFKTVQDDFSEGLKSITGVPEKPPSQERLHHIHQPVNLDAGGELLHRYEGIWKELYTYTEETAKNAQTVDVEIAKLLVRYERQSEILTRLHQEAANLPMLLTQLQDITNSLAQVEEDYGKVEVGLVHLENLCEELDYQKETRSHHNQLAVYKMKKEHEIQRHKVQLAREHAHNVQKLEKKREQLLKERQSAYEEQFSSDVDFYKKHGKLERLPSTPEAEKKLDIADVQIEEDPNALDDFLASSASETAIAEQNKKTEPGEPSDEEGPNSQAIPEITSPDPTESSGVTSPTSTESSVVTSPTSTESSGVTSPASAESSEVISPDESSSTNQSSSTNDIEKDSDNQVDQTVKNEESADNENESHDEQGQLDDKSNDEVKPTTED